MAWSGEGSEYDEGEDEETATDIDDLPDEELIVVLRDEQNSIKEAQRLIHKEIKSIRRELKRLIRHYAAAHPNQQVDVQQHQRIRSVDSGLGEVNYSTDYTTASEVASSHEDSEVGYQAFLDHDTDQLVTPLKGDGMYSQQSSEVYEAGTGCEEEGSTVLPPPNYKGSFEHPSKTENGFRSGYGIPLHWSNSEITPALDDHTRGKNSTYEDAYSMVRRRHSADKPLKNSTSKSSGNRWKSIIHKHGQKIYSIPESHQNHLIQESVQSSGDESLSFQDLTGYRNNEFDQPRRYSCSRLQSRTERYSTRQVKRTQSAQHIDVRKDTMSGSDSSATNGNQGFPRPNMPILKKTDSSRFLLRPESGNEVLSDRPPSVASDTSERTSSIRQWNGKSRMPAQSSEDEVRDLPRFSDRSYDCYFDAESYNQSPHFSPGLSKRTGSSKHHQQQGVSPTRIKRASSSPSGTSKNTSSARSRNARQSHTNRDDIHRNAFMDENWNAEPLPESQSDLSYPSNEEAYMESYTDHAAQQYRGQKHPYRTSHTKNRDTCNFLKDVGGSPTHPLMKAKGLVSSIP
ncbi:uncharacterized protein LOC110981086 [Acanthaster planci]|uniref:Uncharacterized protein LOC110981086 n=1 Tax=Acanthaster planci TaxID=133434 RepID=A0A8B7YRH2_ACAPL|nr:uncharacterized protein LOC110981086 [Acanthaster planci]XP_022094002.1 uncharacterized protein LOC110981086 [Acanthaster planci]